MTHAYQPSDHGRNRLLAVLLLLLGFAAFWTAGVMPDRSDDATQSLDLSSASRVSAEPLRLTPIEELRCGQRVLGRNPIREEVERADEPEPDSWRLVTLVMMKTDGSRLDIELLRPTTWIDFHQASPGETVFLAMHELGAWGDAEVVSIESCPPIESGEGSVITGRFVHEASETVDLYVEGQDEPIGCTPNHPFWSVDRDDFVDAGELREGERLLLYNGDARRVVSLLPRPGPETVYNLEVHNEHAYHVGLNGVLVHNVYNGDPISMDEALEKADEFMEDGVPISSDVNGSGIQFIQHTVDDQGRTITRRVGFDVNPNSAHVQNMGGPHLNLQTQINNRPVRTGPLADPHIPIDPATVRDTDF